MIELQTMYSHTLVDILYPCPLVHIASIHLRIVSVSYCRLSRSASTGTFLAILKTSSRWRKIDIKTPDLGQGRCRRYLSSPSLGQSCCLLLIFVLQLRQQITRVLFLFLTNHKHVHCNQSIQVRESFRIPSKSVSRVGHGKQLS